MIDFFIAAAVAAFFWMAWLAGWYLPRFVGLCFPLLAIVMVGVVAANAGLTSVRDWLLGGVVVCVTGVVVLAGRGKRRERAPRR
jgi:hypothetical protein